MYSDIIGCVDQLMPNLRVVDSLPKATGKFKTDDVSQIQRYM